MSNPGHNHPLPLYEERSASDRLLCDGEGVCLTCSDEALPARVLSVSEDAGLALVEINGAQTEIDVSLVEAVAPGDWLLAHGGVALSRMEEYAQ
jgi:hydrogenase assembly chaperone HypC/HupF